MSTGWLTRVEVPETSGGPSKGRGRLLESQLQEQQVMARDEVLRVGNIWRLRALMTFISVSSFIIKMALGEHFGSLASQVNRH